MYLISVCIQNTKKKISYISKLDGIMWINADVTIFAQDIKKHLLFFKDRNSYSTLSRKIWNYPIFIWSFELLERNMRFWMLYVTLSMDLEVSRCQWVYPNYRSNFRSHLMNEWQFVFLLYVWLPTVSFTCKAGCYTYLNSS